METIRIGLIGSGHRGYFTSAWNDTNGKSEITALAELDDQAISYFKANVTKDAFITKDYHELLKRDDVDAVVVLTQDYLHKQHAIDVLEAGKHLYLEKPMAITIEDCDEILKAWKKSGKKMLMGFNMRYMPMYQKMKEIIDEGLIGEVKAIWVRHFVGSGGQAYYQDWHRNSKFTNSLLLQKGSHDLDIIHMLAASYTKKVSAFGSLDFYNDPKNFNNDRLTNQTDFPIDVEDNNVLIMEMQNGIKASYMQCHFTPDYSRNYTVIGTKGRIENDDQAGTITLTKRLMKESTIWHIKHTDNVHGGADNHIVEGFLNHLLNDEQPAASPNDGRMSVAVGVKATESLREGGGVKLVPPTTYKED